MTLRVCMRAHMCSDLFTVRGTCSDQQQVLRIRFAVLHVRLRMWDEFDWLDRVQSNTYCQVCVWFQFISLCVCVCGLSSALPSCAGCFWQFQGRCFLQYCRLPPTEWHLNGQSIHFYVCQCISFENDNCWNVLTMWRYRLTLRFEITWTWLCGHVVVVSRLRASADWVHWLSFMNTHKSDFNKAVSK